MYGECLEQLTITRTEGYNAITYCFILVGTLLSFIHTNEHKTNIVYVKRVDFAGPESI